MNVEPSPLRASSTFASQGMDIMDSKLTLTPRGSRKRCREEEVEEVEGEGMEVDKGNGRFADLRSVNSLHGEELEAARTIALERLQKILFVELEDDPTPDPCSSPTIPHTHILPIPSTFGTPKRAFSTSTSSFLVSNTPSNKSTPATISTRIGLTIPSFLYFTSEWLLEKCFLNPSNPSTTSPLIFTRSPDPARLEAIYAMIEKKGVGEAIKSVQEGCVVEVASMMVEFLRGRGGLLGGRYHQALKGVLSVNNASTARAPGSTVALPTESTIRLLRDVIVLLPRENRQTLQYLLSFLSKISKPNRHKGKISLIRQLSTIFGPLLVGTSSSKSITSTPSKSNWEASICELLLYANESGDEEESLLWRLGSGLNSQIVSRTPSRRTPMGTMFSPRRGQTPMKSSRRLFGSTPKRLFGSPSSKPVADVEVQSLSPSKGYILGSAGKFSVEMQAAATVARDSYSKRLKLE
ncbi:hypothetical protein HDV05_004313 [Chytridiales sp. JEL 0842]|nr:hypothetical protein HDV05_004313 [Chytridiales sp. JEL 0842]